MVASSASLESLRRPRGIWRLASLFALGLIVFFSLPGRVTAFEALDPTGNITIVWDVMAWTGDGYTATVTINNYQTFRKVEAPGWGLNITWANGEVIWSMLVGYPHSRSFAVSAFTLYSVRHHAISA